jgi:hypothetical protein
MGTEFMQKSTILGGLFMAAGLTLASAAWAEAETTSDSLDAWMGQSTVSPAMVGAANLNAEDAGETAANLTSVAGVYALSNDGTPLPIYLQIMPQGYFALLANLNESPVLSIGVLGAISQSGNQITLNDMAGGCPSDIIGSYTLSQTDSGIDLTVVSDDCTDRGGALNDAEFTRVNTGGTATASMPAPKP